MAQPSRRIYAVTLFLILLVCYGYFMPRWADWGANSRANLTYAVGDSGVLYIDAYHENTGDKACFPGPYDADADVCNGHYYTDKSIGPSLVALPFYMVFKGIASIPPIQRFIESGSGLGGFSDTLNPEGEGIRPDAVYQGMALTFMTFFATAIPSALLGVVVFLMAARYASREIYAFLLALVYGLATPAFAYSNVLYQHQLAAFGAFVGFYYLYRVVKENASLNWLWLVGILFSLVVITEYPVAIAIGIIFLWAAIRMPNRIALYRVVLGAIPLGLVFAAYNYAIFQTPMPVGYEYSTLWQNVHDQGFLSLTLPNPLTFLNLTFGVFRGLFFIAPVLLLGAAGLWFMWRDKKEDRGVNIVLLLVIGFFALYTSASVMWWGGNGVGPRYLVPVLPFLALPMIFTFNRWFASLAGRVVIILLIALSFANVWIQTISGQAFPPEAFGNPLFEYSLPLFAAGNIARNYAIILLDLPGIVSLIPLLAAILLISLLPRIFTRRASRTSDPAPLEKQQTA